MTHEEVENLRRAMLTVIANLSEHDLRNVACMEDCYYCPECLQEVCRTRDISRDGDMRVCESAWIQTAEKLVTGGRMAGGACGAEKERLSDGNGSTD